MKLGIGMGLTNIRGVGKPDGFPIPSAHAKLLLHFDADFADSSIYNRTPTLAGPVPPIIDATQKVFGAGSLFRSANGGEDGRLYYPPSTDWNITDSIPFQASFRLRSTTNPINRVFMSNASVGWGSAGFHFSHTWNLASEKIGIASDGAFKALWPYVFPLNTWTAHRVNHDGAGNYRWYVNGVLLGVVTPSGLIDNPSGNLVVGARISDTGFQGNMDEVLWEKQTDLVITTSSTYEVEDKQFVIV